MHRSYQTLVVLFVLSCLLVACGSARTRATPTAEEPDGQALYNQNGCIGCHPVTAGAGYAPGPALVNLAAQAEIIIDDPSYTGSAETARGYIRESIVDPNVYLTEGYEPVMPDTHQLTLDEQQVEAIVDYILTLK